MGSPNLEPSRHILVTPHPSSSPLHPLFSPVQSTNFVNRNKSVPFRSSPATTPQESSKLFLREESSLSSPPYAMAHYASVPNQQLSANSDSGYGGSVAEGMERELPVSVLNPRQACKSTAFVAILGGWSNRGLHLY